MCQGDHGHFANILDWRSLSTKYLVSRRRTLRRQASGKFLWTPPVQMQMRELTKDSELRGD